MKTIHKGRIDKEILWDCMREMERKKKQNKPRNKWVTRIDEFKQDK